MTDETAPATPAAARRQRGLGAGLSSLFSDGQTAPAGEPRGRVASGGTASIDIDLIHRNPGQPRRTFDPTELDQLVDSIRRHGLLQPILLRDSQARPGHYEIIAGERRWRAAQAAGLRSVAAVVKSFDDLGMLEAAVVENLQRVDLNPVDEALAYKQLIERFGKTQSQVAEQVGRSRVHVANTVRLLALPEEVQAMLADGQLSAGQARTLLGAQDPMALARETAAKGLTVRELEKRIAAETAPVRPPKASGSRARGESSPDDADSRALEADLSAALGLSVAIHHGPGSKGRLEIAYDTLEQLDDLCRRLSIGSRHT